MIFRPTPIDGVFEIDIEAHSDARGFFARAWCRNEFAAAGIHIDLVQASLSHNHHAGTLRGLHFSWPPSREGKLIRCQSGAVHDVLLDLRPQSPTFLQHIAATLSAVRNNALWCPPGLAHGFQTLEDHSVVLYMMSDFYDPGLQDGVRHDDPAFGIHWPREVTLINDRDRDYPRFDAAVHTQRFNATPSALP